MVPAAVILSITLSAAIWPQLQGILLTAMALGFFIAAMMLMPQVSANGMLMPQVSANGSGFWRLTDRQAAAPAMPAG